MERPLRHLAERQHGLVSREQVTRLGIDRRLLRRRIDAGIWVVVTPRVFRLAGVRPTFEQHCLAAVLDCGPGALVARDAAATLWNLPAVRAEHLDLVTAQHQRTELARVHRTRTLPIEHQAYRLRIPLTSAARTLLDLAPIWATPRLERAIDAALATKVVTSAELHRVLQDCARSGRAGVGTMRRLLASRGPDYTPPESGAEARFFAVLDRAGILLPCRQFVIMAAGGARRVDFAYPDVGLLIEIDSRLFHSARLDRIADLDRDEVLLAAGYHRVLHIGEGLIWDSPDDVEGLVLAARAEAAAARRAAAAGAAAVRIS
jgi:very-short-patch-repair endonuclease